MFLKEEDLTMITLPTVFVFGAGVSWDFGFPLGSELIEKIVNTAGTEKFMNLVYEAGLDGDKIEPFRQSLKSSDIYSIDQWLRDNDQYRSIGKFAIAHEIAHAEQSAVNMFRNGKTANNQPDFLYKKIWNVLADSWPNIEANKICFITFNYDRSFEYYLMTKIHHSYGKTFIEAAAIVEKIPIFHIYGSLGPVAGNDKFEFGGNRNLSPLSLERAANRIRIIHESHDSEDDSEKAREYIVGTKRLAFFGFGYHRLNLTRLGISRWISSYVGDKYPHEIQIWGSAFGLEPGEKKTLSKLFSDKIELGSSDADCLKFFRQNVVLE